MRLYIRRFLRLVFFLVLVGVLGFIAFRHRYHAVIRELAETQVRNRTSDLINDAIDRQIEKGNRVFLGIVVICGTIKYCIPLSSPKKKHERMKNSMDFSRLEQACRKYNKLI